MRIGICRANSSHVSAIVAKIEWLLGHMPWPDFDGSFAWQLESAERRDLVDYPCADRIGFARLTTMAFGGADLRPLRDQLMSKVAGGTAGRRRGARSRR